MLDNATAITSTANEQVQYVRSLHERRVRYQEQAFVAEGLRTVGEAIEAGILPASLFYTGSVRQSARARQLLETAAQRGVPVRTVSAAVMSSMADTVTPSGILAVLPMRELPLPQPLTWALVIDRLRDPGNMGTILRSALAAGVELVITTRETVDVYGPKIVRAGMGAHLHLPLRLDQPWEQVRELIAGLRVLLGEPRTGQPYWTTDWRQPTALVIGGEAEGAGPEALSLAMERVTIPMQPTVESLNTAVAASILLFEAMRQRSQVA